MADGDEKIDQNDRVLVMNRLSDGVHQGLFNGVTIAWKPGEVRSIQRDEVQHFVQQSRVVVDPTGENPGVYKLVAVDNEKQPLEPDGIATPLTVATCKELAKHGFIDATHLAPDRQFGGDASMQLIDPESGQHPTKMALRGAPKDPGDMRPNVIGRSNLSDVKQPLADLAPSS